MISNSVLKVGRSDLTGWGTAFKGALKIVAFTIVWAIIGGILIAAGAGMAGVGPAYMTSSQHQAVGVAALIGGFILIIIGGALISLGGLASFLKVSSEIYANEVLAKSAYMRQQYYQPPPQYQQYPQQPPPGQQYPR